MRIRAARTADAAEIAQVHVRAWRAAYAGIVPQPYLDALDPVAKTRTWQEILGQPGHRRGVLVAHPAADPQRIAAFATYAPAGEDHPHRAELGALYADPDHWGTGTGRELTAATVTAMREAGYREAVLWVLAENARARRFYESAGWRHDGTVVPDDNGGVLLDLLRYGRPLTGTQG
ncbi:GNAT family N-acetyltransferase [Streptomyces sp. LE64]|uniref:GNAT family N-acetyltransferase n=1 Tax=Streptomyces sp. LE64 TaxID=3448653 RepID=UPI004042811C